MFHKLTRRRLHENLGNPWAEGTLVIVADFDAALAELVAQGVIVKKGVNYLLNIPAEAATSSPEVAEGPASAPFEADPPKAETAHELVDMTPRQQALAAFKPQTELLAEFNKRFGADVVVQYDMKDGRLTPKGDKAARDDRLLLVTARTTIDKRRKQLNEDDQQRIATRNEVAKEITAQLEPYETTVDELIKAEEKRKAEEKAEAERLKREKEEAVAAALNAIHNVLVDTFGKTAAEIATAEAELRARELTVEVFGNRYGEAVAAKDHVLLKLADTHAKTLALEERERLAKEADARRLQEERDAEQKRQREEAEERDRQARIAKENEERAARLAKEEEELTAKRKAFEAEQEAARLAKQKAEDEERAKQRAEEERAENERRMHLSEIEGVQQQAMIAYVGRAPHFKGGIAAEVEKLIEQTLAWNFDHMGAMKLIAEGARTTTLEKLRATLVEFQERDRKAEAQRIADEAAAEERRKADEAAAAERKRLDDEARAKREREEAAARRAAAELARAQNAGPRLLAVMKQIAEACDTLVGEALAERMEALTPTIKAVIADGEVPTLTEEAPQADTPLWPLTA
jgi:hypothetical protein